jgi:hypothetical protein
MIANPSFKLSFFAGFLAVALSGAAAAQAPQSIAIPAFYNLSDSSSWNRILAGGAIGRIVVIQDGLPIGATGHANDCLGSPAQLISCLHQRGQLVLGYVPAGVGNRDNSCTPPLDPHCNSIQGHDGDSNVNEFYTSTYSGIDGIFFDSTNNPGEGTVHQTYYQGLFAATILKPGGCSGRACVMLNSSQFEDSYVINSNVDDFVTTYEAPIHGADNDSGCGSPTNQGYFGISMSEPLGFCPNEAVRPPTQSSCSNTMMPNHWYFTTSTAKQAYVLRQPPPTILGAPEIANIVNKSRMDYGTPGFIYIHDEGCAGNGAQYTHLSQYFEPLVGVLASHVTVTRTGSGSGTVTAAEGIQCDGSALQVCGNHFSTNTSVTLTAHVTSGVFGGFTINGSTSCSSPCTIPITSTAAISVAAAFNPTGTLSLTKSGAGTGTVTSSPAGISCNGACASESAPFTAGAVLLTASADSGSTFNHFAVAGVGNCSSPCSVTVAAGATTSVSAVFDVHEIVATTLTVTNSSAGGSGTVTSSDGQISCGSTCSASYSTPDVVTLTATPLGDGHSNFNGWSGACTGTGTCTVTMSSDQAVIATFGIRLNTCPPGQSLGCCPGDPCRPSGTFCTAELCGGGPAD